MRADEVFTEHRRLMEEATREPAQVVVPGLSFAMVDGRGDPNGSPDYTAAIEGLYAVSYAMRFGLKKEIGLDYHVAPLEGLWWADEMETFPSADRSGWRWTMMIAQPEAVTDEVWKRTVDAVATSKRPAAIDRLRLERFEEGSAVQVLHLGPYSSEGPTIERLHDYAHHLRLAFDGREQRHHEIYLGDPRRAAPERLRTVIRQPVRPG